jgi:hypothetical protein
MIRTIPPVPDQGSSLQLRLRSSTTLRHLHFDPYCRQLLMEIKRYVTILATNNKILKDSYWIAPVIASLVAAFGGSFFGALFKEQLSDRFYKRKRRREIRASVSKEVVIFIHTLMQQVQIKNFAETLVLQRQILDQDRAQINDPTESEKYVHEVKEIIALINIEAERDEKLFHRVTEVQGSIHSLVIEATHYIKKRNAIKLRILLKEIQSERHTKNMMLKLYDGDKLNEIISFRNNSLPKLVQQLIAQKQQKIDYYIDSINSLI